MEYKQLEFFLAVCEQKSFSRAAEVCYVSQQAISKSLANLEQELGVQLFVRNSGGVALTEAGRLFEQQVRPIPQVLISLCPFSIMREAFDPIRTSIT